MSQAVEDTEKDTDLVVLGAGPAGYVCAIRLAQLKQKVAVIDRAELGGVCLNRGCIPSKALIHAGSLFEKMHHASLMGITAENIRVDFPKLMKWKDSIVTKLTGGVGMLLKGNGCEVVSGEARFLSPNELEVKSQDGNIRQLRFKTCVIATGSRPIELPGFPIDQTHIMDSTGALSLQELPKSLLCVGGGYIGLELGTFYAKMGTQVTIIEALPQILSGLDPDLTQVVIRGLRRRKVEVLVNTRLKSHKTVTQNTGSEFEVTIVGADGNERSLSVERILLTVGRKPNTDSIGLEKAGIKTDPKGFIPVDSERRTNVPGIFAIGDITGNPLLAHKGSKEGIVAAEVIAGQKSRYEFKAMPAVVFTEPEVATVGLSGAEATLQGFEVQVGTFPFGANGRSLSMNEMDGIVKMVGDAKTGKLLGVQIAGVEASNLIAEAALALEKGAQVADLARTIHAHPTLPETLMEAAEATLGHAIHVLPKKR